MAALHQGMHHQLDEQDIIVDHENTGHDERGSSPALLNVS
jgi:hypothetical protein